jgi:o-succinylbenzoate synthase
MDKDRFLIQDVQAYLVEVPLAKEWQISLYSSQTRQHLVVKVTSAAGVSGLGEASPSPAFMGEYGEAMVIVVEKLLKPALVGLSALDLEKIHSLMDGTIHGNTAAKAAVDIALHDLIGKALEVPVYDLLGGRYREGVPLTWVVGIKPLKEVLAEVRRYVDKGYKTLKIKLGRSPAEDLEVIRQVRKEVGDDIAIRVDANQAYTFDQAVRLFKRMEKYEIESIEQPLLAHDLKGMRSLAEILDTPVMADEAVFTPADAFQVARERAADIINIKIGKVGGLYPAQKIASIAQAAGITCTVGSNLELEPGISASLHFALAASSATYPSDLFIGKDLHQYGIADLPSTIENGVAYLSAASGLGINLRKEIIHDRSQSTDRADR